MGGAIEIVAFAVRRTMAIETLARESYAQVRSARLARAATRSSREATATWKGD